MYTSNLWVENSIRHKWDKGYHVEMIHHSLNEAAELDVKTVRFPAHGFIIL